MTEIQPLSMRAVLLCLIDKYRTEQYEKYCLWLSATNRLDEGLPLFNVYMSENVQKNNDKTVDEVIDMFLQAGGE